MEISSWNVPWHSWKAVGVHNLFENWHPLWYAIYTVSYLGPYGSDVFYFHVVSIFVHGSFFSYISVLYNLIENTSKLWGSPAACCTAKANVSQLFGLQLSHTFAFWTLPDEACMAWNSFQTDPQLGFLCLGFGDSIIQRKTTEDIGPSAWSIKLTAATKLSTCSTTWLKEQMVVTASSVARCASQNPMRRQWHRY